MLKQIFDVIFEVLLFYATTYSGHKFWTERNKSKEEGYSVINHTFWIVLSWIGLWLFTALMK